MAAAWLFAEAPRCPVEVFRPAHRCHQRMSLVPRAGNLTHGAVSAACTPPLPGDRAMSRVSPGCWSCRCHSHGSQMEMGRRGGGIEGCSVRRSRDLGLAIFTWSPAQSFVLLVSFWGVLVHPQTVAQGSQCIRLQTGAVVWGPWGNQQKNSD